MSTDYDDPNLTVMKGKEGIDSFIYGEGKKERRRRYHDRL
jgi:hypothetical protein